MRRLLCWLAIFRLGFYSNIALSGEVRTLKTNDSVMAPIHLAMGQSTVLRFRDKPKKVIVGNQNYFNIEFNENDLAIQPLGIVTSNLFVYTEYQTYGFILKVAGAGVGYDDIVGVVWKSGLIMDKSYKKNVKVTAKAAKPLNLGCNIGASLSVSVQSLSTNAAFHLLIIDMDIKNVSAKAVLTKAIELSAARADQKLSVDKIVFDKDEIKPSETARVRIILEEQKKGFTISLKAEGSEGKIIIPEGAL